MFDSCSTQLKAQGPSRTCNESKEEEEEEEIFGLSAPEHPPPYPEDPPYVLTVLRTVGPMGVFTYGLFKNNYFTEM